MDFIKYPDQREDLLKSRIFRLVPEISIKRADHHLMQLVLQSIQGGVTGELKKLTIKYSWRPYEHVDIAGMDPEVVAGALTKLETVDYGLSWSLSAGQVSALISRICQAPVMRLSELHLLNKDLSLIPPGLLTGAIQRLEMVLFSQGRMTGEQVTAILTLAKEDRLGRIKRIRIKWVAGMRSVSSSLIKEARLNNKLEWVV